MDIAISSCEQGTFQGSRATFGFLRLYANGNWVDSNGQQHIGGAVDSSQYYESFPVTIDSDGIIHIPSINIQTTTDAQDNPNVRITAAVYIGNGKTHSNVLIQNAFIPVDLEPSTTWEIIRESNEATQAEIGLPPTWWVLVLGLFNTLTSAAQKASRVIFGVLKTSVDPEDAANPIAVGDNDARVNTVNAAQYSSFSAAVDAVASLSGTNILEITTSISTGTKSVPADVIVQFTNGGKITATSGTVTILGEIRAPAVLCFVESGGTIDISDAKAEQFFFEWKGITSGADNTASIQWLIDQRKGWDGVVPLTYTYASKIQLVQGVDYSHATAISFDNSIGLMINGVAGGGRFQNGFTFTANSASPAYTFKSCFGCVVNSVRFRYTNTSYSGKLVSTGHSIAVAADTQDLYFRACQFTGTTTAYLAAALVCFDGAINSGIADSYFAYAQTGYYGYVTGGVEYSVRNQIQNCTWNDCGIHVYNTGESFTSINDSHEANFQSLGGVYRLGDLRCYDNDPAGSNILGLTIINPWAGDGAGSASTYGAFTFRIAYDVNVIGGAITVPSGTGAADTTVFELHGCGGVNIFARAVGADYYGAYDTTNSIGVTWSGDDQCLNNVIQSRNGAMGSNEAIIGNYTKANSLQGVNIKQQGIIPTNTYGDINIGYKTSDAATNAATELAVMDSAVTGFDNGSFAIISAYNNGDNPIYLASYTGTDLIPRVRVSASVFRSEVNDGVALGDTTHGWSDLFLASGALININNGNWLATHSSGILTVTTGDLRVTTAGTNSASVVTVGGTQTLTNKTLTSPVMTAPTLGVATATSVTVGTLYLTDGTVKQVEVGAADSGGTGYKLLRVLN